MQKYLFRGSLEEYKGLIIHFNVLATKRATYDQFGEEGLKNGVPEGSGESGAWTQGYSFHGCAEKVFRDFFGGDNPFQGKLSLTQQSCQNILFVLKIELVIKILSLIIHVYNLK